MRACIFAIVVATVLAFMPKVNAADLGRYEDDRGAEVVLRGMEIIAGAIASRQRRDYYYDEPSYPAPRYYDPYGTYYRDPYGVYHYREHRYHRHQHRHHRH